MHQRLTKKIVQDLAFAQGKQEIIWDTELAGFGILLNKTSKSYIIQKKVKGRAMRVTLGRSSVLSADIARNKARKIALDMMDGINHNQEKRKQQLTLKDVHQEYIKHKAHILKQGTLVNYVDHIENHFAGWHNKVLTDIDTMMVIEKFHKVTVQNGTYAANNAFRYLSALFNYAGADDMSLANPVEALRKKRLWNKKTRRHSFIKDSDLQYWYQAVCALENDSFRDAFLLLLFTGLRKMEAFSLRWADIDFAERSLTILNTKNGKPLALPMTDFVYDLLQARKAGARSDIWVFDSKTGGGDTGKGCIIDGKKSVKIVCAEVARLKGDGQDYQFMLHDLRRTFMTMAERIGVSTYRIKLLVNHSTDNDVTAGYIQIELHQLMQASQQITDGFMKVVEG